MERFSLIDHMIYVPDVFLFMENKKKTEYSLVICNICRQSCHSLITNHAHDKHCCFTHIDSSMEKKTIDIYDIITMTLKTLFLS